MRKNAVAMLLMVGSVATLPAAAQVFKIQGGASSLLDADGGSIEFKAPRYSGNLGVGTYDGHFEYGAVFRSEFHDHVLTSGDDSIQFNLPTDWFDGTHYFLVRGAGISHIGPAGSFRAFAGSSATGLSTGFFQAAHANDPTALFFYDRRLTAKLSLISRNVVSKYQTALEGVSWHARDWLDFSATGGLGSNQAYAAGGLKIQTEKLILKAAYIETGTQFRRITVVSPVASEVQNSNVELAYRPNQIVSLTAGHHNILEALSLDKAYTPASVNEIGSNFHLGRNYFGAGYFQSTMQGRSTQGANVYAGRRVSSNVEVTANYFTSQPQHGAKSDIASATVREVLSKHISVSQLITRSNGQTTVAMGGDLLTNRVKFRADYQNVYLPYRPDHPFEQALAINAAVRVSGPLRITVGTNVGPDGRPRYTTGVSTYLYRERGMWRTASETDSFSFPKYVILGVVHDPEGAPVEGAAIHIGKQVVYSDDAGKFLLRSRKRAIFPVQVALDEFLMAGSYEVITAPASAQASSEDNAQEVKIVVRRSALNKPAMR